MQRSRDRKPAVWNWYVLYCVSLALVYLGLVIAGFVFLGYAPEAHADPSVHDLAMMGPIFIAVGLLLFLPFAAGPFLPRRRWGWVFGLVLICVGLTSLCCMLASIPLLIFWLKPETKAWFDPDVETAPVPVGRRWS